MVSKKKINIFIGTLLIVTSAISITFPIYCAIKSSDEHQSLINAYKQYCNEHPLYGGDFNEWSDDMKNGNYGRIKSYETFYNIIYANASVPPVLAAIESIDNCYETYALIERGKTYAGIEETHFHNLGFDPTTTMDRRFTQEEFDSVVNKIKELDVYGHEHFNIYVVDYRALEGAALAANAKLTNNQYHVYLIEDGNGAYIDGLSKNYIEGKTVTAEIDEPYALFETELTKTAREFNFVMSHDNNKIDSPIFDHDNMRAWAIPVIDNFTYLLQDRNSVGKVFDKTGEYKTKMASVYGFGEGASERANTKYQSIVEGVNKMSKNQKEEYLKLMYGQYYEDTYNTLTRSTLDDGVTVVPAQKLVFIPGRINKFHEAVTDLDNGIGGLTDEQEVPSSYDNLDNKYKIDLLFDKKDDYDSFLLTMDDERYWKGNPTKNQRKAAKRDAFNYLLNYIFILKWAYAQYGYKYDIIMKGHPSEEIDHPDTWRNHYIVQPPGESEYIYDYLISGLALNFHHKNSVGKYIGMVPYGTAAENLPYLGINMSVGGLPSSTYIGYDPDVPTEFVINIKQKHEEVLEGDGDITSDPNLASRYEAGNLFYYDDDGNRQITKFINRGKFFEIMRDRYISTDPLYTKYDNLRTDWLKSVTGQEDVSGYTIDDQGFYHVPTL